MSLLKRGRIQQINWIRPLFAPFPCKVVYKLRSDESPIQFQFNQLQHRLHSTNLDR